MFFARITPPFRRRIVTALAAALLAVAAGACATASRYQGMGPEQIHALAQQDFDRRRFDDAVEALDRLLLVYPEYPRTAEARFLLARAYFEDRKYLLAGDEYMRFLERHLTHFLAPEAAMGVCLSYAALSPIPPRDQTYTGQAYRLCGDVAREYGQHAVAAEAASIAAEMRSKLAEKDYLTGEHYFRRGSPYSAIMIWAPLAEEYPDTEWAPRALLGVCRAYRRIGYEDDAEDYRLKLLTAYPDSDAAQELRNGADC